MSFWKRLFGGRPGEGDGTLDGSGGEHALLLHIRLGNDQFGDEGEVEAMHALQDELEAAVVAAGAGELDGDEFGAGECVVYFYGPDAERLWAAVEPVLESRAFRKGSYAVKRFGEPGVAREDHVDLH